MAEVFAMTSFARVQEILNNALTAWEEKHGRPPIIAKHDPAFGWTTRDQLVQSVAFGKPLITQEQIDNHDGDHTNLVVALRTGVAPFKQMPIRGPFLTDDLIKEIVDWINGGALADPPPPPPSPSQGGQADA
jgi:hypothetical protein